MANSSDIAGTQPAYFCGIKNKIHMKKVNIFATFVAAATLSLGFASCNSTPVDPVAYNNQLMTAMNNNDKNVTALNSAMASQDYVQAETARKAWEQELDKSIAAVNKIEEWKEDAGFKAAVTEGLKGYKKLAGEDYKKLIELRGKEKAGDTTVQSDITSTLDKINTDFEALGGKVNKAGDAFIKKHSGSN